MWALPTLAQFAWSAASAVAAYGAYEYGGPTVQAAIQLLTGITGGYIYASTKGGETNQAQGGSSGHHQNDDDDDRHNRDRPSKDNKHKPRHQPSRGSQQKEFDDAIQTIQRLIRRELVKEARDKLHRIISESVLTNPVRKRKASLKVSLRWGCVISKMRFSHIHEHKSKEVAHESRSTLYRRSSSRVSSH